MVLLLFFFPELAGVADMAAEAGWVFFGTGDDLMLWGESTSFCLFFGFSWSEKSKLSRAADAGASFFLGFSLNSNA